MPAETVLEMATLGGARALGLEDEIGSLEVGKRADVTVIRADGLHQTPSLGSAAARIVFSSRASDVDAVVVDGRVVVRGGRLLTADETHIRSEADRQASLLVERAGFGLPNRA